MTVSLGGRHYVFPAAARRYLARYLDPSLFDVDQLASAEASGRLPLRIRYAGAAPPSLPGVSVVAAGNGSASGYLTPSSAKRFGAALARQAVADSAAARPGVPDSMVARSATPGLFGSVTSTPRTGRSGSAGRFVFAPDSDFAVSGTYPTPMPLTRREYTFGPAGYRVGRFETLDLYATEMLSDETRTPVPGELRSTSWFRQPFIAGVQNVLPENTNVFCPACRGKTSMTFAGSVMDNVPEHSENIFPPPGGPGLDHFKIFKDGALLGQGDGLGGVFAVPAAQATYRVLLDADRSGLSTRSTQVAADITFVSGRPAANPLPGVSCSAQPGCAAVAVLRAQLDRHASARSEVPVGVTTFDLDVRHFNVAKAPWITSALVQARRSGTTTWATLPIRQLGPGRYTVPFTATAAQAGQTWDLKVSATDAAGGVLAPDHDPGVSGCRLTAVGRLSRSRSRSG
jgi:hypothetical protein